MARACGMQHRMTGRSETAVIGVDYFFITAGGMKRRPEMVELGFSEDEEGDVKLSTARGKGEVVKCVITTCSKTKAIFLTTK